jgi:hypothetical protein
MSGMASGRSSTVRVITSTSAAVRLEAARAFLGGRPPGTELLIVGASRGAADDLAREIARHAGSTFGITRVSFTELAARAAAADPAAAAGFARLHRLSGILNVIVMASGILVLVMETVRRR